MPMTMKLPDPKTGRMVSFDWPRETPPTEQELEQYVFQPARQKAQEAGLIPPGLLSEGPLAPARPNLPATPEDRERQAGDMNAFMGYLLELGAPIAAAPLTGGMSTLPAIIANMGVNAVAGGLAAPLIGKDPTDEALSNAALGAVGDVGGKVIPVGANMLGQAFGGKIPSKKDAMAFMREGGRQWKEGRLRIGLGNEKRTEIAAQRAGEAIEAAEDANPARLSLPDAALEGYNTISGHASTANFPQDVRKRGQEFVKKYVTQQAAEAPPLISHKRGTRVRTKPVETVSGPTNGPAEGDILGEMPREPMSSHGLVPAENRLPQPVDRRIGARRRPMLGRGAKPRTQDAEPIPPRELPPGPDEPDPTATVKEPWARTTITPNPFVSVRRAGDLKRAAGKRSSDVIKARKAGQSIPADMQESQQTDAAMEKAWRQAQYAVDGPKNIPFPSDDLFWPSSKPDIGPIQAANLRRADLHRMADINTKLKDPTVLGRIGQFTTRLSLGAGLGQAFSETTGADRSKSTLGGAAAGLAFLNPRSAGATGNALGILTQALPHTVRLTQAAGAFPDEDKKKKKKTQRKAPK